MAQILVRNLETDIVEKLRLRAKQHGRSLQGEAKQILTKSAGMRAPEAQKTARQWHKELAGRKFPDTAGLLRQDRAR
jgi:plasmid stability protein